MRGGRLATALFAATLLAALVAARAGAIGFLYEWGGSGSAPGEFGFPVSVATNALGQVYVADSENNRIEVFDEAGAFVSEWGTGGTGPGAFNTPESVAVDPGGRVYVVDKGNFRVEKFSAEGAYLGQWEIGR